MKKYAERDGFACYLIEKSDWRVFKDIQLAIQEEGEEDIGYEQEEIEDDSYWQQTLKFMSKIPFCLMKGDDVIGYGEVDIEDANPPHITSGYVLNHYRGQRLIQILEMARFKYLADLGHEKVGRLIHRDNQRALSTVERGGFKFIERRVDYLYYERELNDLNPSETLHDKPKDPEP